MPTTARTAAGDGLSDDSEVATVATAATIDFDALDLPIQAKELMNGGAIAFYRVSFQICRQTKPDLVAMVEDLERKGLHECTLSGLQNAHDFFSAAAELTRAAEIRFLIAASVMATERGATE